VVLIFFALISQSTLDILVNSIVYLGLSKIDAFDNLVR